MKINKLLVLGLLSLSLCSNVYADYKEARENPDGTVTVHNVYTGDVEAYYSSRATMYKRSIVIDGERFEYNVYSPISSLEFYELSDVSRISGLNYCIHKNKDGNTYVEITNNNKYFAFGFFTASSKDVIYPMFNTKEEIDKAEERRNNKRIKNVINSDDKNFKIVYVDGELYITYRFDEFERLLK